jgi:hypothetical protein
MLISELTSLEIYLIFSGLATINNTVPCYGDLIPSGDGLAPLAQRGLRKRRALCPFADPLHKEMFSLVSQKVLPQPPSANKKKNYEIQEVLGTGSFGKVMVSLHSSF